jgi:CRISPR/Cas system-associated exonuclease Cas4 (RecB family)
MYAGAGVSQLLRRLGSYDADRDHSEPIRFLDLAKQLPNYDGPLGELRTVGVASFARLAYCPFTIWHNMRGTPQIRPPRAELAVSSGLAHHSAREATALAAVAKAKPASKRQLRDPNVDLVELPEFPAQFLHSGWLYRGVLDGLSRKDGNLVVHELKTGRYARMPDHILQVWAYCLAAPGAMTELTSGALRANGVSWTIEYPLIGETWGPYPFRAAQLGLLSEAMSFYEDTGLASTTDQPLDLGWQSFPAKCAPCSFAHACQWKVEARQKLDTAKVPSVTLDSFLDSGGRERNPHGDHRRRRHRDHRARQVRR